MKDDSYSYLKLQINSSLSMAGRKKFQIGSVGSSGVLDENDNPVSATLILLQKVGGLWLETGRINTEDGGFLFKGVTSKAAKVIAEKDSYNDGIMSKIIPEPM